MPENFSQVRQCYIVLNFQNFQESRDVKIANGKSTFCAKRGKAITFVCDWGNGSKIYISLCVPRNLSFGVVPSRHIVPPSLIRTLRARLLSLRSVVPSRHLVLILRTLHFRILLFSIIFLRKQKRRNCKQQIHVLRRKKKGVCKILQTPKRADARPYPFNATSVAASFCNLWTSSRNARGSIYFFIRKCKKIAICLDIFGGGN